jgi:hypothetical protein
MTHSTPVILELLFCAFYQLVMYRSLDGSFPNTQMKLGRWLGCAHHIGQQMCYWILQENCPVVARSTVRALDEDEKQDTTRIDEFNKNITNIIGEFDKELPYQWESEPALQDDTVDNPNDDRIPAISPDQETVPDSGVEFEPVINASILLPRGDRHILELCGSTRGMQMVFSSGENTK